MSNDDRLTMAQEARADDLWAQFERLESSGTLNLILCAANEVTRVRDLGQEADTSDLEYLLGTVEDLVKTVGAAFLGILVEAEETWGGIENAPADYFAVYLDLRSLKEEVEVLRKDARNLCSRLPKVS